MNNDFLDTALVTGKQVLRRAGEAACDFADTARIKFRISELESAVNRKYRRLGRLAYNAMDLGGLAMTEDMQKIYNEITDLKQSIAALKEEL